MSTLRALQRTVLCCSYDIDLSFSNNVAQVGGGAIWSDCGSAGCSVAVEDCVFARNSAVITHRRHGLSVCIFRLLLSIDSLWEERCIKRQTALFPSQQACLRRTELCIMVVPCLLHLVKQSMRCLICAVL